MFRVSSRSIIGGSWQWPRGVDKIVVLFDSSVVLQFVGKREVDTVYKNYERSSKYGPCHLVKDIT